MDTAERADLRAARGERAAGHGRLFAVMAIAFVAAQIVGSGTDLLFAALLDRIQPGGSVTVFGVFTGLAALCALFAHPLVGMASDRTPIRLGRRSAWVAAGAVGSSLGLLALGQAGSVLVAGACYVAALACVPAVVVPLYATIPDRLPVQSRGMMGSLVGASTIVGGIAGNVMAARLTGNIAAGLALFAALLLGAAAMFVLTGEDRREPPKEMIVASSAPARGGSVADLLWFSAGRFGIFFGYAAVASLAYYILRDDIGQRQPAAGVAVFALVSGGATFVAALVSGPWSDRVARRKPFVVAASLLVSAGAAVPAIVPTYAGFLAGGGVIGLGFGVYLAVGTALGTLVLPHPETTGRDLGFIGFSNAAAQVVAPLVGAALAATLGYRALFVAATAASVFGALAILPIRTVREGRS